MKRNIFDIIFIDMKLNQFHNLPRCILDITDYLIFIIIVSYISPFVKSVSLCTAAISAFAVYGFLAAVHAMLTFLAMYLAV